LIQKIKEEDARRNKFATIYWESRKRKGFSYDAQKQCVSELFCCDDGKMKVMLMDQ
jgi:phosphotransacetylase